VILARHGEPALSRRRMLCADEYREWWADYEVGGLAEGQAAPEALVQAAERAGFIIASTRLRSIESAQAVSGDRDFVQDPLFIEAPLPPPHWPRWLRLSPRVWGFTARFWWWWFNHHDQQESRKDAEVRADEAARQLIELAASGQDVLVIAHGFFNTMVGLAMRRRGWPCVEKHGGFRYWSTRRFESPAA
jgi:broad specificity phosphatase PhoE